MIRRNALFIGLLVVVAVARFTILLVSQTHVHSDEAIIGLMGKHILEGRSFPFYMYGQPYNAGAAWEAYLAVIPFSIFGVGVVPLKSCIVVLSLLCLVLFYWMCAVLYNVRTALFASIVFALAPSLLKWHFQVRGYSWYFLSIPLLTTLWMLIQSDPSPKRAKFLMFGICSGLSIWCLELALPLVVTLSILLIVRRKLSLNNAAVGIAGFAIGYAPAIAYNLTHHFSNWKYLTVERPGGGLVTLFHFSTYVRIFFREMPKFFGSDTVLWYYPETPLSGFVFYAIAMLAVACALWPFVKSPSKIGRALRGNLVEREQQKDLALIALIVASFVPYLTVPVGVPSYFFGGCFFLSALTGRLLERSFSSSMTLSRLGGAGLLGAVLLTGIGAMIDVGRHNQIETLTSCDHEKSYCMTRIPAHDIEGVQEHLRRDHVTSVWTTISFVYPLLFESGETLAVSDAIFGYPLRVYPRTVPWREPIRDQAAAFVIESDSTFRRSLEIHYQQATGSMPSIAEYGKLVVIEAQSRNPSFR